MLDVLILLVAFPFLIWLFSGESNVKSTISTVMMVFGTFLVLFLVVVVSFAYRAQLGG